jgi:trigger factor
LNVQTEHLENRVARLTIEIDNERLEKAKRAAARKIAKRVNIRGFRKGKATYDVLVRNGLEPQILDDAINSLSHTIYRETLEESELEPYAPGEIENIELEPVTKFIYTVPLQPIVELNDYKSIRHDYEVPEVTDEQVETAMKEIQEREALVEETEGPIELGNRVTIDIHSELADDAPEPHEVSEADDEAEAADAEELAKGYVFIHEHDTTIHLDPEKKPILPGFADALVGANLDEDVEFELTVPEDDPGYQDIGGRLLKFQVTIKKIEHFSLPEMDDDLAARLSKDGEEPLTLLQLRLRVREQLREQIETNAKNEYFNKMLDDLVEEADVEYPLAMVEEQIDAMIKEIGRTLQQRGMNLDTYLQRTEQTEDEMREIYREQAAKNVGRSLVMREIVRDNGLEVTKAQVDAHIEDMLTRFGEQSEQLRPMFDNPQMRSSTMNKLLHDTLTAFVFQMGQGEDIEDFMAQQAAKDAELKAEKAQAKETAVDASAIATVDSGEIDEVGDEQPESVKETEGEDTSTEAEETEDDDISVEAEAEETEGDDTPVEAEAEETEGDDIPVEAEAEETEGDDTPVEAEAEETDKIE